MVLRRKGQGLPIKAVALITLGLVVVALIYGMATGWFKDLGLGFVESVDYPAE